MNNKSVAPCGLICDLCYASQREKNKCDGCNSNGNIIGYCTRCAIKNCSDKKGNPGILCFACKKYPCKLIKALEKRYVSKYGESPIGNLEKINRIGIKRFIIEERENWKCPRCGELLCVHNVVCSKCGAKNKNHPEQVKKEKEVQ